MGSVPKAGPIMPGFKAVSLTLVHSLCLACADPLENARERP